MAIHANDKLIRRKQPASILALRVVMVIAALIFSAAIIGWSATTEGAYAQLLGSSMFAIALIGVVWYLGKIMHIEYKYYMEDGILHIDQSFMHYTSKEIFALNNKDMELVCREGSEADKSRNSVKTLDYSSREKRVPKVALYFHQEGNKAGRLVFEPDKETIRYLQLFLKDKVQL